jgi:FlaA1/EpsC-like NDP-sugar epimerase
MGTTSELPFKDKASEFIHAELKGALERVMGAVRGLVSYRTSNIYSHRNRLVIDAGACALSITMAYWVRFEGPPTGFAALQWLLWLPSLVALHLLVNSITHVDRFVWRFVSLSDAVEIACSGFVVTGPILALALAYPSDMIFSAWLRLPLSVIVLEYLLSLLLMLSVRVARKTLDEKGKRIHRFPGQCAKPLLLYGAGRAGVLLLTEFGHRADVNVVGFIDDDPMKIGRIISGIPVLGNAKSLRRLVQVHGVREVVISIASASAKALANILSECQEAGVQAKIIPSLEELVKERINISRLRTLRLNDLLGRETVDIRQFDSGVRNAYKGKRILVTGGGGSIGSELVRQLLMFSPQFVAILDKDENSVYELVQELRYRMPEAVIEPQIADLRSPRRVRNIFAELEPQVVFHAAAHKHVPLMEKHPCEAVLNNIYGTKNVVEASCAFGVERFVFISSDKAVNPTNIMGATKRVGEKLVQAYAKDQGLRAACVRFGNVLGSRGSVIPIFEKQIAMGGPITITHPEMVRFFMTIPEAVQLVLCAGSLADVGDIFVLDMGSPRKIVDLACQMVKLCGLEPEKDIAIEFTGLRPGEKMHEELVGPNETRDSTRFPRISVIRQSSCDGAAFRENRAALIEAAERNDSRVVYETFARMDLGFKPS